MNSTTKIIAGVAVLALLFAGIGFASVDYTSETNNTENEITTAYITVGGTDSQKLFDSTKKVAFDTVVTDNTQSTVESFKLAAGQDVANKSYILKVIDGDGTNSKTGATSATLTITAPDAKIANYFTIAIQAGTAEPITNTGSGATWTFVGLALDTEYVFSIVTKSNDTATMSDFEAFTNMTFEIQAVATV